MKTWRSWAILPIPPRTGFTPWFASRFQWKHFQQLSLRFPQGKKYEPVFWRLIAVEMWWASVPLGGPSYGTLKDNFEFRGRNPQRKLKPCMNYKAIIPVKFSRLSNHHLFGDLFNPERTETILIASSFELSLTSIKLLHSRVTELGASLSYTL